MCDREGVIFSGRKGLNNSKIEIAKITNAKKIKGTLKEAVKGADVFIGVSAPNLLDKFDILKMKKDAIVFAMANPLPEIMPQEAIKGGARIVATGRSDFQNQINNVLAFPGIFRGALDKRVKNITEEHKIKAARAIAGLVKNPKSGKIIPEALDPRVAKAVSKIF